MTKATHREASPELMLSLRADPPQSGSADDVVKFGLCLSLHNPSGYGSRVHDLDLHVLSVGNVLAGALDFFPSVLNQALGRDDQMHLVTVPKQGSVKPDQFKVDLLLAQSETDLGAALQLLVSSVEGERPKSRTPWVLLFVHGGVTVETESLVAAVEAMSRLNVGAEIVCLDPTTDMRLLNQIACLGGGELLVEIPGHGIESILEDRLRVLASQIVTDLQAKLVFDENLRPQRLYRSHPRPAVLRDFSGAEVPDQVAVQIGPVGAAQPDPMFLLTGLLPKRPPGIFPVLELQVDGRIAGEARAWTARVEHPYVLGPITQRRADPLVNLSRERVAAMSYVEEIAHAYSLEDGARIANLLDSVVRHFMVLGYQQGSESVARLRTGFLRGGIFGRTDLNQLRLLALQSDRIIQANWLA